MVLPSTLKESLLYANIYFTRSSPCQLGLIPPQVLIKHRGSDASLALVEDILRPLKSRYVYLTYEEHDIVTANTQAVTHAAFLRFVSTLFSGKHNDF